MKILLACGIFSVCAFAETLTWDKLIASAEEDPVLQASQKKQNSISARSGTKLWDELEFEYKLNGFGFQEHEFELEMKPKAFGEGAADEAYWKSQAEYQKAHQQLDHASVLYERYEHALRFVRLQQTLNLHLQLAQIAADRVEVLHALSGSETFHLQDLVSAMEEQVSIASKLVADSNSIRDSKMKLLSWVNGFDDVQLDSAFLPTVDELKNILNKMSGDAEKYSEVVTAKAKWQVDEKRAEQETAGDRNYITQVSVGYKYVHGRYKYKWVTTECHGSSCTEEWQLQHTDDDRRTRDKFFASIGFRLPFFNSNNSKELKRQIDVLESERDYQKTKRDVAQKVERRREEILGLIAQREVQKKFVDQVDQGALFEDFANRAGNDPLLLLRARQSSVESQLKIVAIEDNIFTVYLDLLFETGALGRTDVSNHLKAGPEK